MPLYHAAALECVWCIHMMHNTMWQHGTAFDSPVVSHNHMSSRSQQEPDVRRHCPALYVGRGYTIGQVPLHNKTSPDNSSTNGACLIMKCHHLHVAAHESLHQAMGILSYQIWGTLSEQNNTFAQEITRRITDNQNTLEWTQQPSAGTTTTHNGTTSHRQLLGKHSDIWTHISMYFSAFSTVLDRISFESNYPPYSSVSA